jgi:hypothetical protein
MKTSVALLALGFATALSAAVYLGISAAQQRQANLALNENLRAQAAESAQQIQRVERSAKLLEAQVAVLKGDLAAAKVRGAEREDELTKLRDRNAELAQVAAKNEERLVFAQQIGDLSRYDTAAQILGLPACTLTDAQNQICAEGFNDSAGNPFHIGGPGASREVAGFIRSLEDGKKYALPAAFIEYQKRALCKTAAQVLAIKSCTTAVEEIEDGIAVFKDKDGRRIRIGGENVTPELVGFLKTLEEGKSYSLPAAFIEYQKKQAPEAKQEPVPPPKPPEKGDQF